MVVRDHWFLVLVKEERTCRVNLLSQPVRSTWIGTRGEKGFAICKAWKESDTRHLSNLETTFTIDQMLSCISQTYIKSFLYLTSTIIDVVRFGMFHLTRCRGNIRMEIRSEIDGTNVLDTIKNMLELVRICINSFYKWIFSRRLSFGWWSMVLGFLNNSWIDKVKFQKMHHSFHQSSI